MTTPRKLLSLAVVLGALAGCGSNAPAEPTQSAAETANTATVAQKFRPRPGKPQHHFRHVLSHQRLRYRRPFPR